MSFSYPLSFPDLTNIQSIQLTARNATAVTSSPFTYKQQVLKYSASRWEANITLPPMKRADSETWITFLMKLNGQYGTFLLGDPLGQTARGSASTQAGTPLVNGANQTGSSISVDGLPLSVTGYLLEGDYIQLGSGATAKLHKVMTQVNSDASGTAVIDIWPDIRTSPADNDSIVVANAQGIFRLLNPEVSFSIDMASIYGINFSAVEAL
jgi:hypothetical protein